MLAPHLTRYIKYLSKLVTSSFKTIHQQLTKANKTENRTQVSVSFGNKFALKRKVLPTEPMKPKKKKKFRTASQLGLYLKK